MRVFLGIKRDAVIVRCGLFVANSRSFVIRFEEY